MEKLFDLSEIVANSPLAAIPLLFQAGQIPDELLPKTAEDRAAISALQSSIWPINDFLASNTRRLKQRLPMQILCLSLAEQILPFIRRAYRKAVGDPSRVRREPQSELRALASFIHFSLQEA